MVNVVVWQRDLVVWQLDLMILKDDLMILNNFKMIMSCFNDSLTLWLYPVQDPIASQLPHSHQDIAIMSLEQGFKHKQL